MTDACNLSRWFLHTNWAVLQDYLAIEKKKNNIK